MAAMNETKNALLTIFNQAAELTDASERAKFLEQFIEGLRHSEANREIFLTAAPSEILGAPSTRIPRNFGRAQGVRTHSWARRSAFRH